MYRCVSLELGYTRKWNLVSSKQFRCITKNVIDQEQWMMIPYLVGNIQVSNGFLVLFSMILLDVYPYLGKLSNLTNILQMGWNHPLALFHCPLNSWTRSLRNLRNIWCLKIQPSTNSCLMIYVDGGTYTATCSLRGLQHLGIFTRIGLKPTLKPSIMSSYPILPKDSNLAGDSWELLGMPTSKIVHQLPM